MKKTITISKVEKIKEGFSNKTGRKWELFRITDEEGETYSTFSNAYNNMIGQKVEIEYEITERNGYKYKSILDRKKSQQEEKLDKIIEALKVLNSNIKAIDRKISNKETSEDEEEIAPVEE